MSEKKYKDLVRKLEFKKGVMGGANANEMVYISGDKMGGFELNFIIGVYDKVGDWAPGRGAHAHPFDEFLLFFGYDNESLSYLGADMELSVGKEQEQHTFSDPTIVVTPKGIAHCPLLTKKVYKPFGHFHLALAGDYTATKVEKEGTTDGDKYSHLFKKMPIKQGPGKGDAKELIHMTGDDLEGSNLNFTMGLYDQPGEWNPGKGAQVHPYDKCIVFFGHNTDDLSYLGAEITIEIGEEHEKHTFDAPTVISLPKGTPHFPVVCHNVEKQYGVMQVGLSGKYEVSWID